MNIIKNYWMFINEDISNKYIVYHGGSDISEFDYSKIGNSNHGNIHGNGFYFTSEKNMAIDFAAKISSNRFVYTCQMIPKTPLTITDKGLDKMQYKYLDTNDDINGFWENMKLKYDCIIVTDRKFGGNMKFSTRYENFTEIVVYDKSIITILKKEKY